MACLSVEFAAFANNVERDKLLREQRKSLLLKCDPCSLARRWLMRCFLVSQEIGILCGNVGFIC